MQGMLLVISDLENVCESLAARGYFKLRIILAEGQGTLGWEKTPRAASPGLKLNHCLT